MSSTTCAEINTTETIDLLGRQDFVDQLLRVAETLSNNKKNACYAVNGTWGTGKTFVMNMFEQQASQLGREGEELPRYLVFHYNCWEYDYYEEPLVAILRSVIDNIDEKVNLFSGEDKSELCEILKAAAQKIGTSLIELIAEKTSIPLDKVLEIIKDGHSAAEKLRDEGFDPYCKLKEVLKDVRAELTKIADYQTVIVVVDELDRCLPEYAIKVMERLHHLFEGVPNIQVILSVDKLQLEHTVKQIYGAGTNVNKYLAKFIQFQLELSTGTFDDAEKLDARFNDYFNLFEYIYPETTKKDINAFCKYIFEEVDVRSRIAVIEKCMLIHNLLYPNEEKGDFSIMCIEVFLAVIHYYNVDISSKDFGLSNNEVLFYRSPISDDRKVMSAVSSIYNNRNYYKYEDDELCYIYGGSVWGVVLAAYYIVLGGEFFEFNRDFYSRAQNYKAQSVEQYVKSFWSLLQIIN